MDVEKKGWRFYVFKKLRIGTKLIVAGTVLMIIPLAVVTLMAVRSATFAITGIEPEQLGRGARHIAGSINSVLRRKKAR